MRATITGSLERCDRDDIHLRERAVVRVWYRRDTRHDGLTTLSQR